MDGQDRPNRMWKTIKQRLMLKLTACFGSSHNLRVSNLPISEIEAVQIQAQTQQSHINEDEIQPMMANIAQCIRARGIDLATLLAAERESRKVGSKKHKKHLMRLYEEIEGVDSRTGKLCKEGANDNLCCVCMERNIGAAFVPCGHTYCRVCSRELWLKRVPCPLCNCRINQVLDIF